MSGEEALQRAMTEAVADIEQGNAKLCGRHVRRLRQKATDQLVLGLDPARPAVAAQRSGRDIPLAPLQGSPATDARGADPEPDGRGTVTGTRSDCCQYSGSKVDGKSSRHDRQPLRRPIS